MARNFAKIAEGIDTAPALQQLAEHPELWGQIPYRKALNEHAEMDDIWLRMRPMRDILQQVFYTGPFFCDYYPAWHTMTELHPIVAKVKTIANCDYLGAILLTRIPPGGRIKPHSDAGAWHADFHTYKVYIPL